jgi:uncharacterized protein YecT (DUF1311 family)
MELDICAKKDATQAEHRSKAIYQQLIRRFSTDPIAFEKIANAEKAWIAYRDAYIEAMYPTEDKQEAYATMYPMQASLTYARLTEQHIHALKDLINQTDHY